MRFSLAVSALLFSSVAASDSKKSAFTPLRVHYDDVLTARFSLLDALEDSSGIVSMTNLPENFAAIKKEVMGNLHSCVLDQQQQQDGGSGVVAEQSFSDGTVRRSLATATTVEEGPLPLELDETALAACRSFQTNVERFRAIALLATQRFTAALSREMEPHLTKPLLTKKGDDSNSSYDTIEDLVENGVQLEHFHTYQKIEGVGEQYDDKDDETNMTTIDLHADQGFFIAFTPGMMIGKDNKADASGGFYIVEEDSNDIPIHVDFDVETDDLVFMLGDGVNQYINNRFIDGENNGRRHLRATPHSVSLKVHDPDQARVWYGRMVLPPNDALVAAETTQTTLTYGEIRRRLVETPDAYVPAGLGCSSPTMRALQHADNHDDPSACDKGSLFCWARCMELADYELTEEMCAEQNLDLKCINPRGQFTSGERHGDFWPACSNTTLALTPYPEILQKNEDICTNATWDAFVAGPDDVVYDHSFNLKTEKNNGTVLQWSVVDEEQGIVKGRLVFNDVFGWLSLGFADPEGKHNGMNGANILMALPGGNYSSKFGLEVPGMTEPGSDEISIEISKKRSAALAALANPEGSSIQEFQINPEGSSFRHWNDSGVEKAPNSMDIHVTECATSMTFETDNINGQKFSMTGMDDMIWGGNSHDYHVGYHGRANRARFYINWMTGEGEFWVKEVVVPVVDEPKKEEPAPVEEADKKEEPARVEEDSSDYMDSADEIDDSGTDRLSEYFVFFAAAIISLLI